jgi:probable HAF family extracellular repeat protein
VAVTGPERRARLASFTAAVAFGLVLVAGAIAHLAGVGTGSVVLLAYDLTVCLIAIGLAADLLWGRWAQGAVTGLVVNLGEPAAGGVLRDRLARALGDPTLVVAYSLRGPSGWGTQARSFVWQNGVMHDIGTLGGPDAVSTTQNAHGQITGQSWTSSTPNPATGIPTLDPFLWTNGHMRNLGTLGGTIGMANWLTNRGEVVGFSDLAGDQTGHPFLWANGHMRDLGTLGGDCGFANWVNDRGDVVGGAQAPDQNFHGFLWRNGKMHDLPPVGGAPWAFANSVNDHGQVVGNETDAKGNERFAALWSGGHGYNLNTLIAPSALHLTSAEYINDLGEIVGHGVLRNGHQRVFLLIRNPSVPLPSAAATLARDLPAARLPHPGHSCGTVQWKPLPFPCWAPRSLVPGWERPAVKTARSSPRGLARWPAPRQWGEQHR